MKNTAIVALIVLSAFLADRAVQLENQYYALVGNSCKFEPADPPAQWKCLENIQTRTSWLRHLYYAVSDHIPPVPMFKPEQR